MHACAVHHQQRGYPEVKINLQPNDPQHQIKYVSCIFGCVLLIVSICKDLMKRASTKRAHFWLCGLSLSPLKPFHRAESFVVCHHVASDMQQSIITHAKIAV